MAAAIRKLSPFRLTHLIRQEKNPVVALQLFRSPNSPPMKFFPYSFQSYDIIICKLGRAKMFREMEQILRQLMTQEIETNRLVPKEIFFCQVISFYGRGRLPDLARTMYDLIPSYQCRKTIKSFNSLLNSLLICREFRGIERLCREMDLFPDACTYNILIKGYCSVGSFEGARKLFDEMCRRRISPNVVTFVSLISFLCLNSRVDDAFELKNAMIKVHNVSPNIFVYTSLVKGLCDAGKLDAAVKLKDLAMAESIKKNSELDSAVYTTLIRSLFRSRRRDEAIALLDDMQKIGVKPDTHTYNAVISGFCDEKDFTAALTVLEEMSAKGCKADVLTYNVMITSFCNSSSWVEAIDLFEDMPRRGCPPNVVTYRILVDGLLNASQLKDAAFFLEEMIFKGFKPHPETSYKLVNRLKEEGDVGLMSAVIGILAKGRCVDCDAWRAAVEVLVPTTTSDSQFADLDLLAII
ncbi:putative Pentatricopeptide repeat-containing protein [Zostera marina]|uniref:Putative Pentatricopeptide repeat-containing protein n=1 Tax=Zostera marina TaxID=29655 RepID=A0A0K9NZ88_ZOSMR|nr:putative Pentatricopeptide repeat-containing protein [Zostera marina]